MTIRRPGAVIWIPCDVKSGIFPTEQRVTIEVNEPSSPSIVGFVPNEDIRQETPSGQNLVRAVVMEADVQKTAVVLRGEMLSHSNRVFLPSQWLERFAHSE